MTWDQYGGALHSSSKFIFKFFFGFLFFFHQSMLIIGFIGLKYAVLVLENQNVMILMGGCMFAGHSIFSVNQQRVAERLESWSWLWLSHMAKKALTTLQEADLAFVLPLHFVFLEGSGLDWSSRVYLNALPIETYAVYWDGMLNGVHTMLVEAGVEHGCDLWLRPASLDY